MLFLINMLVIILFIDHAGFVKGISQPTVCLLSTRNDTCQGSAPSSCDTLASKHTVWDSIVKSSMLLWLPGVHLISVCTRVFFTPSRALGSQWSDLIVFCPLFSACCELGCKFSAKHFSSLKTAAPFLRYR